MKKVLTFFLALAASAGTVFAQSGTCGTNLTWDFTDGVLTISGTGEMENYVGSKIAPWDSFRNSITRVTIGNSVTSIGNHAFYECFGLKSVTIGNSVTNIGFCAFYNCSGLTSVTIGNSVTSIGSQAFNKCTSLTSIKIPNSVTSIESQAFENCSALTSVTIPNSVTSIGQYAFQYCFGLISVTIGNSVTSIGDKAFWQCESLTEITCLATTPPTCGGNCFYGVDKSIPVYVPEGKGKAYGDADGWSEFTNIKDGILASGTCGADGDNLTWKLSETKQLTISGNGAMADWTTYPDVPWYSNRSSIKSVVIEDGVTSIGENAFAYCTNLTSVSLPNSVTSMGWCAFTDCTALTSFTISKSVTNIKGGAFLGCTGLTSIIVESGNTTYDSRDNCNAIIETATNTLIQGCKNTIIPYSVTSIGSNAFRDYTNLTSIDIPYSVSSIGYGAFENCSGLTSITCEATTPPTCGGNCIYGVDKSIPVYVPNVDAYTAASVWSSFTNIQSLYVASGTCGKEGDGSNLTWTLSKNGVLTISGTGDMADWSNTNPWYDNRSSIKSVVIEAGVTSIGKYAFYNCDNLTSVTIPGSVTSIGNYAFNRCSSLASVTIPEGVISIGTRAFQNCTSLTSIALPEGITSIGIRTFYQCTSLKSVTIPASVANIIDEAFSGCNALTEITCKATTPPTCASNSFYAVTKSIPVYVPNVDAYTAASVWSSFTNIQSLYVASGTCGKDGGDNLTWTLSKEGVLTISGTGAMTNWSSASDVPWYSKRLSITEVSIGNSVTSIGDGAFAYCTGLTSVTIGNSVTSIGAAAFYNCQKMTSITIPNSVTSIGESAFYACTGLTSVEIPNGVTTIGGFAFANCTALTSVTIPNSVIIIRNNAFFDCTALAAITIPNSVTTIEEQAFAICQALTAVTIPGSVTTIEDAAFAYCTGLTAFNVASDNPNYCSVDGVLFNKDKTNLIQYPGAKQGAYTIPNSVTEIKGYAFYKCSGLTSVTIGNSVTSIGEQALYGCSGLTSITCEAVEPPTLGDYVFLDVDKTIPLYVPAGSVDKYKAAYQWKDFGENIQEIQSTAIDQISQEPKAKSQKILRNGQLLILRDGKTYTVTGQEVK